MTDPECPRVARFYRELNDNLVTHTYSVSATDIIEDFEKRHRAECARCREFDAAAGRDHQ